MACQYVLPPTTRVMHTDSSQHPVEKGLCHQFPASYPKPILSCSRYVCTGERFHTIYLAYDPLVYTPHQSPVLQEKQTNLILSLLITEVCQITFSTKSSIIVTDLVSALGILTKAFRLFSASGAQNWTL